jgi:TonB family protein
MDPALLALVRYSAQILVVVCVAAAAATLLRSSVPSLRLAYWRMVGAVCLAVPWLPIPRVVQPEWSVEFGFAAIDVAPAAAGVTPVLVTVSTAVSWIVAAGILARLGWLLAGAFRLRQLRRHSVPAHVSADIDADRRELAPHAQLRWCTELTHPATFGIRRPVVLLPERFTQLSAASQRAVVRHELLHIARRDWIWIVIEEHVRALFWFHPGIWWLVEQVQLAREQVIDQLVVSGATSKREYMTALMTFADNDRFATLTIAFLRPRHLKHRFRQLSTEAHMSFTRLTWTTALLPLVTIAAAGAAAWALPLDLGALGRQADEPARLEIRLAETTPGAGLIEAVVQGSDERVYLHPTSLATGADVTSVRVVEPSPGLFGVSLTFSDAAAARIASGTTAHVGRPMAIVLDGNVITSSTVRGPVSNDAVITGITAESARQLAATLAPVAAQKGAPEGVTVPQLIRTVNPEYTQTAMAAGIQGLVVLEVVVLADGSVGKVAVVRSLDSVYGLDQKAVEAASQWRFKPGTRDGKPVAVAVTLECTFTLRD